MAVVAKMNPDRKVMVVDIDARRIAAWNSPDFALPIYEPGLVDVVREVRGKNLFFTTDIAAAVDAAALANGVVLKKGKKIFHKVILK